MDEMEIDEAFSKLNIRGTNESRNTMEIDYTEDKGYLAHFYMCCRNSFQVLSSVDPIIKEIKKAKDAFLIRENVAKIEKFENMDGTFNIVCSTEGVKVDSNDRWNYWMSEGLIFQPSTCRRSRWFSPGDYISIVFAKDYVRTFNNRLVESFKF